MTKPDKHSQPVFKPGQGGLNKFELVSADQARAEIYLHGAHLCGWQPAGGEERVFLSSRALFQPASAIRGGVPVIFPQFAALGPLPKHGFARNRVWSWVDGGLAADGAAWAQLCLSDSSETQALWPHAFACGLRITVNGQTLSLRLSVENRGDTPFEFTAALHTYLRIGDIAHARIFGLQGLSYRDSTRGGTVAVETEPSLAIHGEVDRIYLDAPAQLEVREPGRSTLVRAEGFGDAVIWNPGPLAAGLSDLEAGGERHMLCVEAAQISRPPRLLPGESWQGTQTLIAA